MNSFKGTKEKGRVIWQSPSNIAFIKYWGKKYNQIPYNPSLSMTLSESYTITGIDYQKSKNPDVSYVYNELRNEDFEFRVKKYIEKIKKYIPFVHEYELKINSENTFPHSSGIASSASAFSALSLALCSIEKIISDTSEDKEFFFKKASFLARFGSGSACRSIYGPFSLWGETVNDDNSNNEYAVIPSFNINPYFNGLNDAILIVSKEKKKISSSAGHELMNNHPFAQNRYIQAKKNLSELINAMQTNDPEKFYFITENEALTLHALMMTSSEPYLLLHPNSIAIIEEINKFKRSENILIGYSIDAGPNIHLIYHEYDKKKVVDFINDSILDFLDNKQWIDDKAGQGPKAIIGAYEK